MSVTARSLVTVVAAAAVLAACVQRAAPPAPVAPPPPAPAPSAPPPAPPPVAWEDGPLSPGDWTYHTDSGPGAAVFGQDGQGIFVLLCAEARRISLIRIGVAGGAPLIVRTSFGERALPTPGLVPEARAVLAASDPLLDQIAFSRGRFLVRLEGAADLVLPTWPEPARAIEQCRG